MSTISAAEETKLARHSQFFLALLALDIIGYALFFMHDTQRILIWKQSWALTALFGSMAVCIVLGLQTLLFRAQERRTIDTFWKFLIWDYLFGVILAVVSATSMLACLYISLWLMSLFNWPA